MENRQIDRKTTKQVLIDVELHKLLKILSAKRGDSIKSLVEGCLAELLAVEEGRGRKDEY